MNTPITARSLKHHFHYNWWKYLIVLLAGTFLVDLLFTVTAPRIPDEKKVELYVFGYALDADLTAYIDRVHEEEMPEMEAMSAVISYPDETYGPMLLTTYLAAREGDVYLLPREDFLSVSSQAAFLPLEGDAELMALFSDAGLDLRRGWRTLPDSDETHLYGIPMDLLPGLSSLCYVDNGFLAVLSYGGNTENALKFLRILCRGMIGGPAS